MYDYLFPKRPTDYAIVYGAPAADVAESRQRHVAASHKMFALWRPILMATKPVEDEELAGYRQWQVVGGEIVGDRIEVQPGDSKLIFTKIFLGTAVPCALIMGVYYYFRFGWPRALWYGLFQGVVFGVLMVAMQWFGSRMQQKDGSGSPDPVQVRDLELPLSFIEMYQKTKDAIASLKNAEIVLCDDTAGTIEAHIRGGLSDACSQNIHAGIYRVDDDHTGIIVTSEPSSGQNVDYGKNLRNINIIMAHVTGSPLIVEEQSNAPLFKRPFQRRKIFIWVIVSFFTFCTVASSLAMANGHAQWWTPVIFFGFVAFGTIALFER